jgi:3-oxoadipate enol-lactonase
VNRSAEPIVLVPSVDHAIEARARLMPLLSRSRPTVSVAYDGSTPGSQWCSASVEEMAKHVLALLDSVAAERAHMVGIAVGGLVAQQLALAFPERVASVTLASTCCGDPSAAVQPEPIATNMLVTRVSLPHRAAMEVMIPYAYARSTPRARISEDIARRLCERPTTAEDHLVQLMAASPWRMSVRRLREVTTRTLVIHGTHDRMVPVRNAEILAATIPRARFVAIERAGHMLSTDAPERFAQAVTELIDRADGPAALRSGASPRRAVGSVLEDDTLPE